jgi:hypothetical protein
MSRRHTLTVLSVLKLHHQKHYLFVYLIQYYLNNPMTVIAASTPQNFRTSEICSYTLWFGGQYHRYTRGVSYVAQSASSARFLACFSARELALLSSPLRFGVCASDLVSLRLSGLSLSVATG